MIPYARFGKACDFVGVGALLASMAALGSVFLLNVSESVSFSTLFAAMAIAVSAFCAGRLADMVQVLAQHKNPRQRRAAPVLANNLASVPSAATAEQNSDLPRAA